MGVLLLSGPVLGSEATPSGILRIGTPGDYAPYSWYDPATQSYRGSDIALARAIALQLGRRAQFVTTSWSTLTQDAEAGKFDLAVGGISITTERMRVADFSDRYASDRKQPVVRCGEQQQFDSEEEINRPDVRLIVNPGGTNERFARQRFPAASLTVHGDNRTVFDEIRAGRADVMVTDGVEGRLQQRAHEGLCVAAVRANWAAADKAILISRRHDNREAVDAAMKRLKAAQRYRSELSDWEGYNWSGASTPVVQLAALIDERLAVVTEVARAKWNTQAAIEDPTREQALLQSVRDRAPATGVPVALVERFFGAQIEAAKILQRELFARWRKQHQGKFTDVSDLTADIRPAIDRITLRMLEQLALFYGNNSRELPQASTLSLVSPAALKAARAPLIVRKGT